MKNTFPTDIERKLTHQDGWEYFKEIFYDPLFNGIDMDDFLDIKPSKRSVRISHGIIETYQDDSNVYYHIFQKRNSYEYDHIIRGKYKSAQLYTMLRLIPQCERDRLIKYSANELWDDYWTDHTYNLYKSGNKKQLETILTRAEDLFDKIPSVSPCRSWEFPKGRIDQNESPYECSMREWHEETGLTLNESKLLFHTPLTENYTGSDGNRYRTNYYVWNSPDMRYATQKYLGDRIRTHSISFELETDIWIAIPKFEHVSNFIEWISITDPVDKYNLYSRHFSSILKIHRHLGVSD